MSNNINIVNTHNYTTNSSTTTTTTTTRNHKNFKRITEVAITTHAGGEIVTDTTVTLPLSGWTDDDHSWLARVVAFVRRPWERANVTISVRSDRRSFDPGPGRVVLEEQILQEQGTVTTRCTLSVEVWEDLLYGR